MREDQSTILPGRRENTRYNPSLSSAHVPFQLFAALRRGPLEIIRASNKVSGEPGQSQDELPPSLARKYAAAGEGDSVLIESHRPGAAVVMDYRTWHRGLGNASNMVRPMVYARYEAVERRARGAAAAGNGGGGGGAYGQTARGGGEEEGMVKKKRRVAPVPI